MEEKSIGKTMEEALCYKKKSIYEQASADEIACMQEYAEGYKAFLDAAKTEREAVRETVAMAQKQGYTPYTLGDKLAVGDKKYYNIHDKAVIFMHVGSDDIETEGIRILAAHIDNPRLDLKQVPLYEDAGMSFFKTHYYGGIKKYQWTATPLALHGVIVRADGSRVDVCIGEKESDPVFYINDLLPHLSAKQVSEPLGSAISGETLNILVGGIPYDDKDISDKIKMNVLSILHETYGVTEEDFLSAELSLVPAFRARDIGFDRAFIGAYGHDDRVCAYPAMTALFEAEQTSKTVMVILADKEETGSDGLTGMQADIFVDLMEEISISLGKNPRAVRVASKCLSADVTAAYDPNFSDVYEKRNSAMISSGTTISKFTGARGKSSTNDASAEFVGFVRRILNEAGVAWQTAELGRIDAGGGGTVAKYISCHNIETVDIGVPVISMHAPYEVVSKADLYATHRAFVAFIK